MDAGGVSFEPDLGNNTYHLTIVLFELGEYKRALNHIDELIALKYQPYKKIISMGVHVALAARDYQSAANYSVMYLNRWGDSPAIEEVEYRLRNGVNVEGIISDVFQDRAKTE